MNYNKWNKLNLLEKIAFYLIISVIGAIFLLPLTATLIWLLKVFGVI